ncbi:hypothetical protein NDU88_000459 [Pleurodeles waltl]|uniref:Uncharacterized protein n=1 Tax=Pleurodeles waltl TaxID=8319 RepID=A0AAV7TFJ2_PLEWA|nr:hypothetical protein NDU88_000459 [Pleurodeles waltl]
MAPGRAGVMDRRAGGRRPERRCTDSGKATPDRSAMGKQKAVDLPVPSSGTMKSKKQLNSKMSGQTNKGSNPLEEIDNLFEARETRAATSLTRMSFGEALRNGAAPRSKECCIPASSLFRHTATGSKKQGKRPLPSTYQAPRSPGKACIISANSFRSDALCDRLLSQPPCSQPHPRV